jgi:hypothetical protein
MLDHRNDACRHRERLARRRAHRPQFAGVGQFRTPTSSRLKRAQRVRSASPPELMARSARSAVSKGKGYGTGERTQKLPAGADYLPAGFQPVFPLSMIILNPRTAESSMFIRVQARRRCSGDTNPMSENQNRPFHFRSTLRSRLAFRGHESPPTPACCWFESWMRDSGPASPLR